jgi:DNA-binding MarR family transcriptional regulator
MTTTGPRFAELADNLRGMFAVAREIGRSLPHEYPPSSVAVLAILKRHGDLRMSRLAELLDVDKSVASRQVAHLADRGWIDRLPNPYDRRSRLLCLTPSGAEVLRTCSEQVTAALADRLRDWSDEDVARLSGLLARLRADIVGDFGSRAHPETPQHKPADRAD